MPKKKKSSIKAKMSTKREATATPFFMGLSKSQTQSLAVGSIIVGLGLFALATFTWNNKPQWQANVFPTASMVLTTTPHATHENASMSTTPTVTQMISATSTARMADKTPIIKTLPNTSSKVTYTVEDDDNLAKIGKKLCGSDRAWLSIAATNKLVYPYTIQPGETYIITCN